MKRSLRDFLFTLFISVVIFSIAAFFVLSFVENLMVDVVEKVQDTEKKQPETVQTAEANVTSTSESPSVPSKSKEDILTFCVIEIEPIAAIFDFAHLDAEAYGIAIGLAFLIIPIVEVYKSIMRSIEK